MRTPPILGLWVVQIPPHVRHEYQLVLQGNLPFYPSEVFFSFFNSLNKISQEVMLGQTLEIDLTQVVLDFTREPKISVIK